ncbi:MAG: DUF1566 domain-containing protein [Pseudomonadaceae bacterium]|nr:DUF1566 domain-containing protein [Pseudomonadaceae bacterium]
MQSAARAVPAFTLPEIGQAYGGGYFSGVTVQDGKRYLVITAGLEHELKGKWGEYGVKIEGADSFTDGRANTEAMAATGSEVAQKVLALEIGGYSDWAIPARDQQELQYRNLKPTTEVNYCWGRDGDNPNSLPIGTLYTEESPAQTTVAVFQHGGAEAFADAWYWSSSQRSADNAFTMDFVDGTQVTSGKNYELRVRPVRSELIID